jgi:hypothetical protein
MCDSTNSCENISIGRGNSNSANYNYSVAIGNNVSIQANSYFHIGSSSKPLGTIGYGSAYPNAYWPVYINGVLRKIALVP